MSEGDSYYRGRIAEELAAAEGSADPAIAHIHREMARRYSEKLDGQAERLSDDTGMAWPAGGENARIEQTVD